MLTSVTWAIAALFAAVIALLGYGAVRFRSRDEPARQDAGRRVSMRLEVAWTAIAAMLLLGVFLYAR